MKAAAKVIWMIYTYGIFFSIPSIYGKMVCTYNKIDFIVCSFSNCFSYNVEFDLAPPETLRAEDVDYLSAAPASTSRDSSDSTPTIFADETAVSRWGVPESPDSIFAQISAFNTQKRYFSDMASESSDPSVPITASLYRQQQSEWLQNARQEKLSKVQKKCKKSLSSKSCEDASIHEARSNCRNDIGTRDMTIHSTPESVERPFIRDAIKMVEVLSYGSTFFRFLNNLDFEGVGAIIDRYLLPDCSFKIYCSPDTLPRVIVPKSSVCEYFKILSDAVPDALWRVEGTRLRQGKPRTVISDFSRSGICTTF